jgi:hypothetical protein
VHTGERSDCCPPLSLAVELSSAGATDAAALRVLPARPGVLALEDHDGRTLSLITTADVRRAAMSKVGPIAADQPRSPRADLRGIARTARALTVGSAFEADWACLQLARIRLPQTYRHMLDRWQAWFVHCDDAREHPQWVKTSRPGAPPTEWGRRGGVHVGPFADKHAAHRFIDMLEDAFDLCRYHHILTQAPHGQACAYKEMGRCPAPCDGSVTMADYLGQVRESLAFARSPASFRQSLAADMRERSAAMDFEAAQRLKAMLDRTQPAESARFRHVRELAEFRLVVIVPSQRPRWARLMAVCGGWIAPIVDVAAEIDEPTAAAAIETFSCLMRSDIELDDAAIENMGLVCHHLLLPQAQARRRRVEFLHWPGQCDPARLIEAARRVTRDEPAAAEIGSERGELPDEQELEGFASA